MIRFAANLTTLFTELPIERRFAAAADAGFSGVEILFPYDIPAKLLTHHASSAGLDIALINTPPPNWTGGPRGFAAQPGNEERFRHDFDRALRFAQALSVRHIHIMAGRASGAEARKVFVENLKWATRRAVHISLTIKPMNHVDMPGYFLSDYALASDIITEIGAPNLGLQYDCYHAQIITGDALQTWSDYAAIIRHVQIAGYPGGHEPDTGEINLPKLLSEIENSGYRGWVSANYNPSRLTDNGLGWLSAYKKIL